MSGDLDTHAARAPETDLRDRLAVGLRHHRAGELSEAERIYREILQRAPSHPDALNLLGAVALATGHLPEAEQLTALAADAAPQRADIRSNLGNILLVAQRPAEAEACLRAGVRLDPKSVECLSNLGLALAAQGRFDQAIAAFREALELRPGTPVVLTNLGIALKSQGWFDEAIAALEESGRTGGWDADLVTHLILALHQAGRTEEALTRAEAAFLECRHSVVFRNAFGRILLASGRPVRAASLFRGALDMMPEFAEARSYLDQVNGNLPTDAALHLKLCTAFANGQIRIETDLQPLRNRKSALATETVSNALLLGVVAGVAGILVWVPFGAGIWAISGLLAVYLVFGGTFVDWALRRRLVRRIETDLSDFVEAWGAGALILTGPGSARKLASPKEDWRLAAEDPSYLGLAEARR